MSESEHVPNQEQLAATIDSVKALFSKLEEEMRGPGGEELAKQFHADPLSIIESRGVDLSALKDEEARQGLATQLSSAPITDAESASVESTSHVSALGSSIGCWACVKATETAISIGAGAALAAMFVGGSAAVAAIATVSGVAAAILGISLAAARQIVVAILSKVSNPGAFVNQLAREACKKPCT